MMQHHELKLNTEYFGRVLSKQKTFEIRENDRDYQVGDQVRFMEFLPDKKEYTNYRGSLQVEITYVTSFQQKEGWIVFGFVFPKEQEDK